MFGLSQARMFFRVLFRRRKLETELDDEVNAYVAMLVDRHESRGLAPEEARRAALIEFEGMEQVKEQVRDVRVGAILESYFEDIRYAWRTLMKSTGFAVITILTLALGIGISTAIFSVVYTVLLRPLPYDRPQQLAFIWSGFKSASSRAPTSGPALIEIQHRNRLLQDVAAIWVGNGTFTGGASPEQVKVAFVTSNFLRMLGVRPELGRVFAPDEQFGNRPAIVLTHGLWQRRFGGSPSIIGTAVPFLGTSATVIGVMPQDFKLYFPADSNVPSDVGAFFPFGNNLNSRPRTLYFLRLLARLKPAVTTGQAQADLNQVAAGMRAAFPEFAADEMKLELAPMQRDVVRDMRAALIALFAGAGFVLLICFVNVANLLLARAIDRRMEIVVRAALGASKGRILRQLLMQQLVLCTIAGAFGAAIGWITLRALVLIRPDYVARMPHAGLNWPVLGFVAAVSLAAAILFGLTPSLESPESDLIGRLRESSRTSHAPARRKVRAVLIAGEVALAFVLLIGAGLMIRTFANIHRVRPGFEPKHLLTFEVDVSKFDRADRMNFVKNFETQIAALPGVIAAGGVSHLPLGTYPNWYSPYRPEGVPPDVAASLLADYRAITPGYFRAMGTRLLKGRLFDEMDRADGRQVVIVDDLLAHSAWPGQSAIGQKIEAEHFTGKGIIPVWSEVVGVVEHVRNHSLSKTLRGEIYIPFTQTPREHLGFAVRTSVEPASLAETIRRLLHKLDKDLAFSNVRPMTSYVDGATAPMRFIAVLAGVFAGLALLLAAIGIYGVISYSISRRSHEMGVRMALGARPSDLVRLVMSEGLVMTVAGLAVGAAGAFMMGRYLQSLLYGVSGLDPVTYGIAIAVIPAAAVLGCLRPAVKAAAANPVDALRAE